MSDDDMKLPALIDRACSRLAEARSSAEVLEAMAAIIILDFSLA